ncbi:MAG: hypothetical protein ACREI5_08335 [Candidatus Methylomirabilales bacterium]
MELKRARHRCEMCGKAEPRLVCHEQWQFDNRQRVLTLQEFQIICFDCNTIYHPGTGGGLWVYKQGSRVMGAKAIGRLRRDGLLPVPTVRLWEEAIRAQRTRFEEPWQLKIAPALRAHHPVLRNQLELEFRRAFRRGLRRPRSHR